MLVSERKDHFQIVLQPDHADVSGQIAARWTELPLSPTVRAALDCAATRHDEGWAVWERHPRLADDGHPQIFYDVELDSILSSYRACVDVLAGANKAAALFVSMHVSGLQRQRYGVMEDDQVMSVEELRPPVREFVKREEQRQRMLIDELGFDTRECWLAYRQLQVYDVFSLYLGLTDLGGEATTNIPPLPEHMRIDGGAFVGAGGLEVAPSREAATSKPGTWTVTCDPFPFSEAPAPLTMRRRLLPKQAWSDEKSFQADFHAAAQDEVVIFVTPAGAE